MAAESRVQYGKLATRYAALTARAKAGDSLIPNTAYADFLRDLERQSLPNAVPTSPPSFHQGSKDDRKTMGRTGPRALNAISVRERAQQSQNETNKHLKAIDDHMWQHRQEERALKRTEIDVVKQRRNLEDTMRKLNAELANRQEEEAEQLSFKEGGLAAYQQRALHERGDNVREHAKTALVGRQRLNEQTKKFMKNEQEMSWRYQNLLNTLQMKKDEIDRLSSEFEKSIRDKEEEQHSLKKNLAALAISMNMEAQKKRQLTVETGQQTKRATAREIMDSLQQQDKEETERGAVVTAGRRYENKKRELEQSATSRKYKLLARQRMEGHKLMDLQTKQRMNLEQQRFTSQEAEHIQLDMMGREIEARVQPSHFWCGRYSDLRLIQVPSIPYRVLSNHGIKGPKPLPIVGNYLSIRKKGLLPFTEEQIKKFGPVVGFYIGADPRIAVVDLELAKDIMVKNFDHFSDRGYLGGPNTAPKALNVSPGLLVATGETWKTGRHAFTPSFSGMKMKLMVPLIKRSSDVLLEKMGKFAQSEKTVEIFREYGSFTIETLIATAFGRYIDVQQGEEADELVKAAEIIFTASQEGAAFDFNVAIVIHSIIPWIMPLSYGIIRRSYIGKALYTVHMTARELIRERIESQQPPKVKDFLQLMIDSTVDESGNKTTTISSEQITAFAVDFLMAGYETTANTLSYTSYLLAMNTDVQDKLQEEIDNYFEENPEVSLYDAAQKLKYLDMVIQESMRFYTPVPFAARHCSKTVTLGNVTIPEGSGIIIPLNIIHHLPEYWPDPYKFDPERFTPEAKAGRHQLAHMPFGWGPRNCIGVRFALLELKIALMEILRKYSFARGPETPAHLELVHGITSVPKNGIMIKIVARS